MDVRLHANATTTPRTRAYIQESAAPVAELAAELGISETTVRRWRKRDTQVDRSHTRHNLNASTTPEQEAIIVALRTDARLSLDDITEVMQRCLEPRLSRSAIRRCLVRHGIGGPLPKDAPPEPGGRFDPVPFGYVHVDLKYLGKLRSRAEYAFVAIERVSRFAHVEVLPDREAATVAAAMARFLAAFGHPVHTVLTERRRVHRPVQGRLQGRPRRPAHRRPSLRQGLRHRGDHPPHDASLPARDQRHGRALQPPPLRGDARPAAAPRQLPPPHPLRQPRRAPGLPPSLRGKLQPHPPAMPRLPSASRRPPQSHGRQHRRADAQTRSRGGRAPMESDGPAWRPSALSLRDLR